MISPARPPRPLEPTRPASLFPSPVTRPLAHARLPARPYAPLPAAAPPSWRRPPPPCRAPSSVSVLYYRLSYIYPFRLYPYILRVSKEFLSTICSCELTIQLFSKLPVYVLGFFRRSVQAPPRLWLATSVLPYSVVQPSSTLFLPATSLARHASKQLHCDACKILSAVNRKFPSSLFCSPSCSTRDLGKK